jgi:hypothetical protein
MFFAPLLRRSAKNTGYAGVSFKFIKISKDKMKTNIKHIIVGFIFISLLNISSVVACTIITASNGKTVLFAGNEDQPPNSSFLIVDKTGTLGVVYFATPWQKLPLVMQMGINEMGLSYDANWIPAEKLNPHPELQAQFEWAITQLMKEASTVNEVLSKIFTYNWGNSISYQVHFADKSGDAVVIYPGVDGELTYSKKDKGNSYLITTNFNHARRIKVSWSFLDFVYSSLFDGTYETAEKMLSKIGSEHKLTVEYVASVLNATHRDWFFNTRFSIKTIYSAVYDLRNLQIYLYYNRQFDKPYVLDLKNELAKTDSYRKVALKDLVSKRSKIKNRKFYSIILQNKKLTKVSTRCFSPL